MIFIILLGVGIIGIVATIWLSSASLRYIESEIKQGEEWFSIPVDVLETSIAVALRKRFKIILQKLLIWLLGIYRRVSREITIKTVVKQKVRAFLSDHTHGNYIAPSEFITKVKKTTVRKPRKPRTVEESPIIEQDIISAPVQDIIIDATENDHSPELEH